MLRPMTLVPHETGRSEPQDVPCIRCSYPLPDLSPTAVCPECGTPVEHTFRGDRLGDADAAYLRDFARGAGRMLLAALIVAAAVVVLLAAFTLAALLGPGWSDAGWAVFAAIVLYASVVEWTRGLRLLSRREAPVRTGPPHERVRAWASLCARWHPVALGAIVAVWGVEYLLGLSGRSPPILRVLGMALLIPAGALVCVQLVVVPWHLRLLASRIPDKKLMKSARTTMIVGVVLIAWQATELLGVRFPVLDGFVRGILGLSLLGWPFATLILIEQSRESFAKLRDAAGGAGGAPAGASEPTA